MAISQVVKMVITEQKFNAFIFKDGCAVPITVCYRTDLVKHDGNAPTLVHVYGMNVTCTLPMVYMRLIFCRQLW